MTKKLNVAIIGCGSISGSHIPSYMENENTNITYFCDIIPERADKAVEKYGVGTAVYNHKELLDKDDIDLVSVCTHNDTHACISIDFMRAGKDVLCEKPAARVLDEALEMQRVAHETGRLLSIGVVNRFGFAVNKVKELIDSGKLGEVYHVYASFRAGRSIPGIGGDFTTKAISGGGTLIDWGVHYLDVILYMCGEPKPLSASGHAHSKIGVDMKNYTYLRMWASGTADTGSGTFDVDDFVTGFVRTEGPTITFNGAWAQNIFVNETFIDILGDKGGVRLNYGGDYTFYTVDNKMLTTIKPEFDAPGFDYTAEVNSFIESVLTRVPNQANIDNAVNTSKIMDAIYRSTDEGREIEII